MLDKLKNFYVNSSYKLSLVNVNALKFIMVHLMDFLRLDRNSDPGANKIKLLSQAIREDGDADNYSNHPAIKNMHDQIKRRTLYLANNGYVGKIKKMKEPVIKTLPTLKEKIKSVQQLTDELLKKYYDPNNVYTVKDQEIILAFDELKEKKTKITTPSKKKSPKKNIKK